MQSDMRLGRLLRTSRSRARRRLLPRLRPWDRSRWRSNRQYRLFDFSADPTGMVAEVQYPRFSRSRMPCCCKGHVKSRLPVASPSSQSPGTAVLATGNRQPRTNSMIQCMFIYPAGSRGSANGLLHAHVSSPGQAAARRSEQRSARFHHLLRDQGTVLSASHDVTTLGFPAGPQSDLSGWKAFMTYALAGQVFAYRPNAADNTTWADYSWNSKILGPEWAAPQNFSFALQLRKWVGATVVSGS